MKSIFTLIIVCLFICPISAQKEQISKIDESMVMPGRYVVKVKGEDAFKSEKVVSIGDHLKSQVNFPLKNFRPVSRRTYQNQKSKSGIDLSRYYYFETEKSVDLNQVIELVGTTSLVEFVEPIYMRKSHYTPNDTRVDDQTYLPVIAALAAWDITKGSSDIVVAVVDAGVDYEHEDLADKIFLNENEIPDNGIDDDEDGYVDNYLGWDFAGADFNNIVEDNDPIAKAANINHGTLVSGCAAASTDNDIGIAGVGFNTKYMALKMSAENDTRGPGGSALILNSSDPVLYAADHGAHVINMSYGGGGYSQFEQDLFTYAAIDRDVVLISSAGNGGTDNVQYPGGYEHVIAVAATTNSDVKASFSEHGSWVDLAAPGVGTLTTNFNNTYSNPSGTSFSSPIVAGAAALLRAHYPNYNQFQIGQLLIQTADDISATEPNFEIGGRLNIFRALTETTPGVRMSSFTLDDGYGAVPIAAETGVIGVSFVNELEPTSASTTLSITQVSSYDITIVSNDMVDLGVISTDQEIVLDSVFTFEIGADVPFSALLEFELVIDDPETGFHENYRISAFINPVVLQTGTIPYAFEDGGDFEEDNGDFVPENIRGTGFERGNSQVVGKSGTASGDFAWVTGLNRNTYVDNSEARLYSPLFDFSAAQGLGYELEFKSNFSFEINWDGFIVEYTTDGGASWTKLNDQLDEGWYQTISDPQSVFGEEVAFFSGTTDGEFERFYTDISFLGGNDQVGFRFLFLSDALEVDAGMAIDDFRILAPEAGPAIPEFTVSESIVCVNTPVVFTNQSSGTYSSISWDFGSGATPSTAEGGGPHEVVYDVGGTYSVSLTVDGIENGLQVEEKVDLMTIGSEHTPEITAEAQTENLYTLSTSPGDTYQWFSESQVIEGATSQTLDVDENGEYSVEVSKDACIGISEAFLFDLILSEEESLPNGVLLYPNPTVTGWLTLEGLSPGTHMALFNVNGARVLSGNKVDFQQGRYLIDMTDLNPGIYLLRVEHQGDNYMQRIIVR